MSEYHGATPLRRLSGIIIASSSERKRALLRTALISSMRQISEAGSLDQTLTATSSGANDVLVLDAELNGEATLDLCRSIRRESPLGILVLLPSDNRQGPTDTLNAGADDYLREPFAIAEFLARVRAIMRRVKPPTAKAGRILLPDRAIDFNTHEVRGPGAQVKRLTPRELDVIQYLVAHGDSPRTVQDLAQAIWQRDGSGDAEYVRVVIRQLRRKLESDPNRPRHIVTEPSGGYRFHPPEAIAAGVFASALG